MDKAIELSAEESAITVTVGRDGVWLNIETLSGKTASFHVASVLDRPGIIGATVMDWCRDREEQAAQIRHDNSQFGVGA